MTVFDCGCLDVARAVTTDRIVYICLLNTTDSYFMAAMLESTRCENGVLRSGFCKACASYFADSMVLYADDGKGILKSSRKNSIVSAMRLWDVLFVKTLKHI